MTTKPTPPAAPSLDALERIADALELIGEELILTRVAIDVAALDACKAIDASAARDVKRAVRAKKGTNLNRADAHK